MAPVATSTMQQPEVDLNVKVLEYKEQLAGPNTYNKKAEEEGTKDQPKAKYPHYLPTWNPAQKYPPLEPFTHRDHGLDADPTFPDLLSSSAQIEDLTPTIGSVIKGIQLSELNEAGRDQVALLTAQRKVLAFRNQNFADLPIEKAVEFGRYFGRLHIHHSSGSPEGHPEIHLVHRSANDPTAKNVLAQRTSSLVWHSDITYENQPPGTSILYIFDKPTTGGDTLFVDGVQAYRRLSPAFRERLHGLSAVHSGVEQAEAAKAKGGVVRREPGQSVHPVVRTHPVTGEKALYVNSQFTRYIVGYKKEESDMLLKFLYDHIAFGSDFQARIKWEEGSVILWDNRVTGHTAVMDWINGQRRHLARITPQAERPYNTPYDAEAEAKVESDASA
ncbi:hypothetical protein MMC12_006783 [Toensbergia leucococca]|nr:hypothetical protein [Toensbergia leucococca]